MKISNKEKHKINLNYKFTFKFILKSTVYSKDFSREYFKL